VKSTEEKCFKVPICCDLKEIMTGYGPLPPSGGVINDQTWANPKGERTVIAFGKPLCSEKIIERKENTYWKYQLVDFKQKTFFFVRSVTGEINIIKEQDNSCIIISTYTFKNKNLLTLPITFLFLHLLWSGLQKKGLYNMKKLAEGTPIYKYPISS